MSDITFMGELLIKDAISPCLLVGNKYKIYKRINEDGVGRIQIDCDAYINDRADYNKHIILQSTLDRWIKTGLVAILDTAPVELTEEES